MAVLNETGLVWVWISDLQNSHYSTYFSIDQERTDIRFQILELHDPIISSETIEALNFKWCSWFQSLFQSVKQEETASQGLFVVFF